MTGSGGGYTARRDNPDNLTGNSTMATLNGTAGDDVIWGTNGNDFIGGYDVDDTLHGGIALPAAPAT